jgi:hypothetical protein
MNSYCGSGVFAGRFRPLQASSLRIALLLPRRVRCGVVHCSGRTFAGGRGGRSVRNTFPGKGNRCHRAHGALSRRISVIAERQGFGEHTAYGVGRPSGD